MGMKLTGKDRIWGLAMAGVIVSFWIWGFQGSRSTGIAWYRPSHLVYLLSCRPIEIPAASHYVHHLAHGRRAGRRRP